MKRKNYKQNTEKEYSSLFQFWESPRGIVANVLNYNIVQSEKNKCLIYLL